jgi:hypothetical protein
MISSLVVLLFGFGFSPVVITTAPALVPMLVPLGGVFWLKGTDASPPFEAVHAIDAVEAADAIDAVEH